MGKLVINDIIPVIALLQGNNHITYTTMFNRTLLTSPGICDIDTSDIVRSDEFFDSLIFNAMIKKRSVPIWSKLYIALDNSVQTIPAPPPILPNPPMPVLDEYALDMEALERPSFTSGPTKVQIIDTAFDPGLKTNSKIKFLLNDKKDISVIPRSRGLMLKRLSRITTQLSSGSKNDETAYAKLSHDNMEGCCVRVNDKNGDPMFIVIPDMPKDIRRPLLQDLSMVQPGALRCTDSRALGEKGKDRAHLLMWILLPSKRKGKKRINTAQCTPRTSVELQKNIKQCDQLQVSLDRLFDWQRSVVHFLSLLLFTCSEALFSLRNYSLLSMRSSPNALTFFRGMAFCRLIPLEVLVLNINATTFIHCDYQDLNMCMVIVATDKKCKGGDLCLEEPGMAIELKNGDGIIFASSKLSHFNSHFKGEHMSLVFHSDASAKAWAKDCNKWKDSVFMNVYNDARTLHLHQLDALALERRKPPQKTTEPTIALLTDNDGDILSAQPLINARPHPTSTEATSSSTKHKSDNMASSFSKRKHQKKKVKTTMHIAATNIINLDEDSDNSGLEYVHEIQPPPLGPASKPPLNTTTNKPVIVVPPAQLFPSTNIILKQVHPVRQSLDLMPTAPPFSPQAPDPLSLQTISGEASIKHAPVLSISTAAAIPMATLSDGKDGKGDNGRGPSKAVNRKEPTDPLPPPISDVATSVTFTVATSKSSGNIPAPLPTMSAGFSTRGQNIPVPAHQVPVATVATAANLKTKKGKPMVASGAHIAWNARQQKHEISFICIHFLGQLNLRRWKEGNGVTCMQKEVGWVWIVQQTPDVLSRRQIQHQGADGTRIIWYNKMSTQISSASLQL
ncbi:hypothetical protein B0H34DRAFT_671569 [Crassisporium funariophilum]|nr:hypothetical protein B0H34DRAFT_671569 [Crassisporium funariophilum]